MLSWLGILFPSKHLQGSLQAMVLDNTIDQESAHAKVILTTYRGKRIASKAKVSLRTLNV